MDTVGSETMATVALEIMVNTCMKNHQNVTTNNTAKITSVSFSTTVLFYPTASPIKRRIFRGCQRRFKTGDIEENYKERRNEVQIQI